MHKHDILWVLSCLFMFLYGTTVRITLEVSKTLFFIQVCALIGFSVTISAYFYILGIKSCDIDGES